jgi:hypothetical protein
MNIMINQLIEINSFIDFGISLSCHMPLYYMIIRDLALQYSRNSHIYYVLLHPCIKVLFDIYSFKDIKIDG